MHHGTNVLEKDYLDHGAQLSKKFAKDSEDNTFWSRVLGDRNDFWMKKIIPTLANLEVGDILLIAVGVLHLYGPRGLVKQLMSEGYTIKKYDLGEDSWVDL